MTRVATHKRLETTPLFLFGASGMLAGELLRLIEMHPALGPVHAISRKAGGPLGDAHPHTANRASFESYEQAFVGLERALAEGEAAAVTALPHGESAQLVQSLRNELGARFERLALVDLAADFRLRDPAHWTRTYGQAHACPGELAGFVYGLPEFHREALRRTRRAAAPGCFATALQLSALPAAREGLLDPDAPWIFHGVTGSSGSGNEPKPGTHHPHRHGNLWAYGFEGHRHEAELLQALAPLGLSPALNFVPHSGPFARGIHLSAALPLRAACSTSDALAVYQRAFEGEPFVEVLSQGVPDLRRVVGSNRAALGVFVRGGVLNVFVTLDNLVKGGAGQALQCLNLVLGHPETWGLPRSGMGVC